MGRHGRPAMTRKQLEVAYREACAERGRLRNQLREVVQDNVRMSGRLAEIDLSMYRLDLQVLPWDQPTEETPVPVDLVKRRPPLYQGVSAAEAAASARAFMIRIHEAAGDVTATQELRIL